MPVADVFFKSFTYNVGLQVCFRVITFVVNALLLRHVTAAVLGIANVRLMLLYTTVSFFSREPFRKTCISNAESAVKPTAINVTWLCPVVCIATSMVFSFVWLALLSDPEAVVHDVAHYRLTVLMYVASLCIESLAEPLWILSQSFNFVLLKVAVDALHIASRQVLFFALVLLFPQWSLLSFGLSMIVSSSLFTCLYFFAFFWLLRKNRRLLSQEKQVPESSFRDLLPKPSFGLEPNKLLLIVSFWKHSFVKQLLTEGERYVITFLSIIDFADQGLYDIVTNLGSLVARTIFAPLEETAYFIFSQNLRRGRAASQQKQTELKTVSSLLKNLLKTVTLIGFVIMSFGYSYAFLALKLYGGDLLCRSPGPSLLKAYCVYVVFLAINGLTEGFAFSIMSTEQVDRHQNYLVFFCIVFLVFAHVFSVFIGSVGFVVANCLNMLLRVLYSWNYIHCYYNETESSAAISPLQIFPSSAVICALATSWLFTAFSEAFFCCSNVMGALIHVFIGVVFLLGNVVIVYLFEIELVDTLAGFIRQKRLHED